MAPQEPLWLKVRACWIMKGRGDGGVYKDPEGILKGGFLEEVEAANRTLYYWQLFAVDCRGRQRPWRRAFCEIENAPEKMGYLRVSRRHISIQLTGAAR